MKAELHLTAEDIQKHLDELPSVEVRLSDDQVRAYLDFSHEEFCVSVDVCPPSPECDQAVRQLVASILPSLPLLQQLRGLDPGKDYDYHFAWLRIRSADLIEMWYAGNSCNATWPAWFRRDANGEWHLDAE